MRTLFLLVALLATVPAHAARKKPAAPDTFALPTPEDPVRLVLHDPTGRPAPSEACDVDLCRSLVTLLSRAEKTIDFAIYGLRGQPDVLEALKAAKARGVQIRGAVDRTTDGKNYYGDTEALVAALGTVGDDLEVDRRNAGNQKPYNPATNRCWLPLSEEFAGPKQCVGVDLGDGTCAIAAMAAREDIVFEGDIMHDKLFVVDGRWVWTGSTNVSDSGTGGYNANAVAVVDSPEIAGWYTRELEQMFGGRYHDDKKRHGTMATTLADGTRVSVHFSPQDKPMTSVVRPLLQSATKRIDVAIFFLTHKGVAADLVAAKQRGVQVRVIMDATAAKNEYAKHELLRMAGIPVKIEHWGGKMHMKSVAVDGQTVIVGSMNWTSAGEGGNDENTLRIDSAKHAAQFHAYFDRIWGTIPDRWLQGRPDPESRDSTTACTDASDNDFDRLKDAEDPGCSDNPPPLPELPPISIVRKGEGSPILKGNIDREGRKVYYIPADSGWDMVQIDEGRGEAYFCSEDDARAAGFSSKTWLDRRSSSRSLDDDRRDDDRDDDDRDGARD